MKKYISAAIWTGKSIVQKYLLLIDVAAKIVFDERTETMGVDNKTTLFQTSDM